MRTTLKKFNAHGLMPNTANYVTYEGSLTFPGCFETVTWIIMNTPIYITREDVSESELLEILLQLQIWNDLQQTDTKQSDPVFMSPNYRPLRALNARLLRTNINVKYKVSLTTVFRQPDSGSADRDLYEQSLRRYGLSNESISN